jgi:hypothetical protein
MTRTNYPILRVLSNLEMGGTLHLKAINPNPSGIRSAAPHLVPLHAAGLDFLFLENSIECLTVARA